MSFLYQIAASLGKPFIESYENTSIIYNEILVCAYLYTLLGLSMCPVSEKEVRANLGWTLLAIIFISTGGNLLKTIILIVRESIHLKRKRDARLRYEEKDKKYAESGNDINLAADSFFNVRDKIVKIYPEEAKNLKYTDLLTNFKKYIKIISNFIKIYINGNVIIIKIRVLLL
jgi:hypothetical protein